MGENQGMVWIVLGVIVVGAIVLILDATSGDSDQPTNSEIATETQAI